MIPYAREAGAVLVLALLTWGGAKLYQFGYENGHNAASVSAERTIAEFVKAEAEAQAKAHKATQDAAAAIAATDKRHEQEKADGQARTDRRIAELQSGERRLRHEIAAYATERLSRDSTAAAELSGPAQRGAELVGAAVGVGAACDARQRALIDAYETARSMTDGR